MTTALCVSCEMPMKSEKLYGTDADGTPNSSYCLYCYENGVLASWCQSCGMPMKNDGHFGTEKNGTKSAEYCVYCYKDGAFTASVSMEEMIQACADMDFEMLDEAGSPMNREAKVAVMCQAFPTLKRWQEVAGTR